MPQTPSAAAIRRTAKSAFGWSELRPGQLEAMLAAVFGRDALVVMPTGAGKSACYQVPALLIGGPTVVVSPLLALQRDQVTDLLAHGAMAANSTRRTKELEEDWEAVAAGEVEFVFLAPEQLAKPDVVDRLRSVRPSLLVVDEAHCVSAWGHDFRPDYLRLGAALEGLREHGGKRPPILALTATASPPVREEIVERLRLEDPEVVVRGFDRPELTFEVVSPREDDAKRDAVVLRAAAEPKPGLVYAATRKDAEAYAAELAELGLRCAAYHSGLRVAVRDDVHRRWVDDELDIVVATTAFGMGIDKPNVRFVIHADAPQSLDGYYQEVGRAARDGEAATCVLFYRSEDLGLRRYFSSVTADPKVLQRVATLVRLHEEQDGQPVSAAELRAAAKVSANRLTQTLNLLEDAGAVAVLDGGAVRTADGAPDPAEAAERAAGLAESRQLVERSRVEMVRGYAETPGCRRQFLLGYFGEPVEVPCLACDNCLAGDVDAETGDGAWAVNDRVRHDAWGDGVVMRCETDRVTVLFDSVGYKTVKLDAVVAA